MSRLPWDEKQDISDYQPVHRLNRLLGPHWLSNSHINSKLLLLGECAYLEAGERCSVRFEACELTNILMAVYDKRSEGDMDHLWLASVGESIARGTLVLTVAHLGKVNGVPHWVAIGVNGTTKEFLYGDSLGHNTPANLEAAFCWLVKQFISDNLVTTKMDINHAARQL